MKIRTGFVSNSSSSSFIIPSNIVEDEQLTTLQVVKHFLTVQKTYMDESQAAYNDVLQWLEDNLEIWKNPIFSFPSCNYDTYVWKLKNGDIKINTCNNVDWSSALNLIYAEWSSYGCDDDDWPEMPMKKQSVEWDSKNEYIQPDRSKIIMLKPNTKYKDLPILRTPPEKKSRFLSIMEE